MDKPIIAIVLLLLGTMCCCGLNLALPAPLRYLGIPITLAAFGYLKGATIGIAYGGDAHNGGVLFGIIGLVIGLLCDVILAAYL